MDEFCVFCRDCGEVIQVNECQSHCQPDLQTFKKPNLFSRVLNTITRPFSSSVEKVHHSGSYLPITRTMSIPSSHVSKKGRRDYSISEHSKMDQSWISVKKKRKLEDEIISISNRSHRLNPFSNVEYVHNIPVPSSSEICVTYHKRPKQHDYTSNSSPLYLTRKLHCDPILIPQDDDLCSNGSSPSDRLNLDQYLEPRISKRATVEAWINKLTCSDPINSLNSPDVVCDCHEKANKLKNRFY